VLSGDRDGPVVVAVGDDSHGSALDWAAAEASARRCALRVVHAQPLRWAVDPTGLFPVVDVFSFQLAAEHLLDSAVRRARAVAPEIEISSAALFGPTVPLLVSQGRRAQLLVLGRRHARAGTRTRGLLGRLARRSPCPVAVVGPLRGRPPGDSSPRVVVGVDGPGACAAELGVAFRAAAQRGLPLTVVHAALRDAGRECACRSVHRALEPWRERFADVPVQTRSTRADVVSALVGESEGAALVVVGPRPQGAVRAALLGSGGPRVAESVRCPLVVVPTGMRRRPERLRQDVVRGTEPAGNQPSQQRRTPWG
jgi:nucleotide-binding universal stress UspA family protein